MKNEWYTPEKIVSPVRKTLREIDLDPASCELANTVVGATRFFDQAQNGLIRPWEGRVFLNPPYERGQMAEWCNRFAKHPEGIILVYSCSSTRWFQTLLENSQAVCFPSGRIKFWNPQKKNTSPRYDSAIFLRTAFPQVEERFLENFKQLGGTFLL